MALLAQDKAERNATEGEVVGQPAVPIGADVEPETVTDDFDTAGGAKHVPIAGKARPAGSVANATAEEDDSGSELLQQVRAIVADDGRSASVRFVRRGRPLLYQLTAFTVYSEGAEAVAYTGAGRRQPLPAAGRHFRTREHGRWATATISEDGAVSGLFEDRGDLLQVVPSAGRGRASTPAGAWATSSAGGAHLAWRAVEPDFLGHGADAAQRQLTLVEARPAEEAWQGTPWWPGCYTGDAYLHDFSVRFIADVSAWEQEGEALQGQLEQVLSQTSFVYERQLNIRLKLASLEIHKTEDGAASYARGCGENFMNSKLDALAASVQPFEGAVHLFTGCGDGYGVVGKAWLATVCSPWGYNTGVTQVRGAMWLTFAHELGHNFGAHHSFEDGKGETGGLMDYGNGTLDGTYQFNTQHRRVEMCQHINSKVKQCQGKFAKSDEPLQHEEPAITSGDRVFLRAHTGKRLTVQGEVLHAEWDHQGDWQAFTLEKRGADGTLSAGDSVYLKAHTGMRLTVQGDEVHAKWDHQGAWQEFTIESDEGGCIRSGGSIYLKAHTGKRLTVQGAAVHAAWDHRGGWQALVIELDPASEPPRSTLAPVPVGMLTEQGCSCRKRWSLDSLGSCESYCCNPDNDVNGPWCLVNNPACEGGNNWGYCAESSGGSTPASTASPSDATTPMPASTTPGPLPAVARVSAPAWEHFELLTALRAAGTSCNGTAYAPNPVRLKFDCRLWRASRLHAQDMADEDYFDHTSQDGTSPWQRARAQDIIANAENIAAGRGDAQGVLDMWRNSASHCHSMMNPSYTMFGVGYGFNTGAQYQHYWTSMFKTTEVDADDSCYPSSER